MEWLSMVFPLLSTVLSSVLLREWKKHQTKNEQEEQELTLRSRALAKGVEALLRDRLVQRMGQCLARGYASVEERGFIDPMYLAYKDLDGNGPITQMHKQFSEMPTYSVKSFDKGNTP